jgi:acetylornithine deacetylase
MKPVFSLLKDLVSIPSESGKEEAVVARVAGEMESLGLKPVVSGRNVTALLDGGDGPLLLLNSHTDTVPVGSGWSRDPLGELDGDRLYGRGSNDAKGCVSSMLHGAFHAFKSRAPKGKVLLAFSCEEEVLGQGLEKLLHTLPKLSPAVAQKGLLLLEVLASGRSAHAAWGGGVNAVEAAARDVLALSRLAIPGEHPVLGKTSLAVTQISGGQRHNVIPDSCKLVVDIRTVPSVPPEHIIALVKRSVEGQVNVRSNRLGSVETDPAHPIVKAALAANPTGKAYGSPTLSDWVFLKGIPTVKAGPGDSTRSHTPDEYLEAGELEAGAAFYQELIHRYFEGAAR